MSNTLEKKTLREWRESAGLTQLELGDLAGCANGSVSMAESGKRRLDTNAGRKILRALGITDAQVVPPLSLSPELFVWEEDGYAPETPTRRLQDWRQRRQMTRGDLALLSGVEETMITQLENVSHFYAVGVKPKERTRYRLAKALRVSADKLILPGDRKPHTETPQTEILRAELRGARRALRKSYDFLREDPNIAFKALEKRDALLKDVEREIRGT